MGSQVKRKSMVFGLLLLTGVVGTALESHQIWQISNINHTLRSGKLLADETYAYQKKFAAAYEQSENKDFKHAVQTYGQLLETSPSVAEQAKIQLNIGNTLLLSSLSRRLNDDGSLKDEAKYDFSQAKLAYEQSLRLAPASLPAKFNLSLLLAVLPQHMKNAAKEQSGVELSNLPIGLP